LSLDCRKTENGDLATDGAAARLARGPSNAVHTYTVKSGESDDIPWK